MLGHHSHTSPVSHCVQPLLELVLAVGLAEGVSICGWPVVTSYPACTCRGSPQAQVPCAALSHSPVCQQQNRTVEPVPTAQLSIQQANAVSLTKTISLGV